jgi:protein-S-isoprenylcysteine O-methyltransferase Ste14
MTRILRSFSANKHFKRNKNSWLCFVPQQVKPTIFVRLSGRYAYKDSIVKLEQKIPPLAFVAICALCMFLTNQLYTDLNLSYSFNLITLLILSLIGIAFVLAGIVTFKIHKTTVNPVNTKNVSTLVNSGIYKHTRNPMYVGMLCVLIGYVVYLANPLNIVFAVFFVLYLNKYQIIPEEVFLEKLFGKDFIAYKRVVRRWL